MASCGVSFSLDDQPNILDLKDIVHRGVNVIEYIAGKDYMLFGQRLLNDKHAIKTKRLIKSDNETVTVQNILEKWFQEGPTPITYGRLIECLEKSDMQVLAQEIKDMATGKAQARSADKQVAQSSASNDGQPKFSLDDEYDGPLALPQGAHEEIKKVEEFVKNEVRIVIQSCNVAEYRAALEMLKPFQDFDAPVKYSDTKLDIIVGIFAGQNTAIVRTDQGVECIEQLKRAFDDTFPNARLLLGLGICYGIKENFAKYDLQFADVLVGSEIGISVPKLHSGDLIPRESKVVYVPELVSNIFCKNFRWDGITVCELPTCKQRTAKVYVGRLCSASILMNDPDRMEKIKQPSQKYLGGEMEGWAQIKICPAQCIIIKGISDFADGKKNDKWQLTAAKAAVSYAHYKLEEYGNINYEQLDVQD